MRSLNRESLLPILRRRIELLPPSAVRSTVDDTLAPAVGEEQLVALIQESLSVAHKTGAIGPKDLERVVVDTTVQPKAVAHPTAARLMHQSIISTARIAIISRDASATGSTLFSPLPAITSACSCDGLQSSYVSSSEPSSKPSHPKHRLSSAPRKFFTSDYEAGAMLITSNRSVAERGTVFADPVAATAILDWLLRQSLC